MTPIEGVSNIRRAPRLGKIRLGIKIAEEGKHPYPRATDYFVVPDEVKGALRDDQPKRLPIMFPTENVDEFAQQWLRCYSFTQGLICKGDGKTAIRKVDIVTGAIANHTTEEWVFRKCTCDPDTCPENIGDPERGIKPQCRRVMNLLFLLPDVPGFGVWQLDTSSFYSIININSCIDLIKRLCGRISFIPLTLSLEPIDVTPPGIKKKTVRILYIRSDIKLVEIQKLGRVPPERVLLPTLEEEEAPEDLFPEETLVEAEAARHEGEEPWPPQEPAVEKKSPDDVVHEDVPDLNAVFRLCYHFYDMQPVEVCKELGYETTIDAFSASAKPWDAWLTVKSLKQP
jgi:hypothetical protein